MINDFIITYEYYSIVTVRLSFVGLNISSGINVDDKLGMTSTFVMIITLWQGECIYILIYL